MKDNLLIQVGVTSDGKQVYAGVFSFYETHGIPLDIIFNCAIDQNWIPCWISLYKEAFSSGMKHERIISKLNEAILDSYGIEYRDLVINNLNRIFE